MLTVKLFVNISFENINLIGEVNWLLGNFYFNQNELKRAKDFYSIALDFYEKNQNVSYLEKVEFYLALSNINLFDNEALLNNADAIANNNNDSLINTVTNQCKNILLKQVLRT